MVSAERSDADLLGNHLAGDPAAFAHLYDRHDRPCFDFIRRMLGAADEATAQDLHQEVWLAVARQGATFDAGKARFVTWLFTIAHNKVMDHHRRGAGTVQRATDSDDEGLAQLPAGPQISPENIAQNRQLAAALLREVQALPAVQRETFVLYAHHELSLDEVAQITRVGLETAKSRLRYARATLRLRLAAWKVNHA